MTLEQLRVFVAVAERQHMTRAAEALNLTQSAASAAVAALEARYGARLFDRVGRGLALSAAGAAFLPEARSVLARADAAAQALEDLSGLRRGVVTLAASQTVASYWLPPRLVRFRQAYPQIELRMSVGNTAQVARAVLEGSAELGFAEGAVDEPALSYRRIGSDRLALLVAPGRPLASQAQVSAKDLAEADWVLREPGSGTRSELEDALRRLGVDPARLNVMLELPSNEAVRSAVMAGGGVTGLSELAVEPALRSGMLRRLPVEPPARPFHLLRHRERYPSRAGEALLALLAEDEAGAWISAAL